MFCLLESLTTLDIIKMMLKRWWIILISVIVFGTCAYLYSTYCATKMYTSVGTLFVNNKDAALIQKQAAVNASDITTSEKLVETYAVILKNDKFMEKISQKTNLGYSWGTIKGATSTQSINETQVLSISVTTPNPYHSKWILQEILNNANGEIKRVTESGSVKIVEDASLPSSPSSPNKTKNVAVAVVLGGFLAVAIIFVINLLDVSVKNEEDLETTYSIPVVGIIPHIEESEENKANATV